MKALTFVLVGIVVVAIWVKSQRTRPTSQPVTATISAAATASTAPVDGWTPVPMPAGANPDRVLVFSALNCPKAAAQRALAIVAELGEQGVPCDHTDHVEFPRASAEEGARLTTVMNAGTPVVFVRGKAKYAPLVDEVVAQYRAQ